MAKKQETMKTILIVDDTPANVSLLEAILSPEYAIKSASRGSEALDIARESPPDLIMLDIMMPVMNGYDVCRALKADEATKGIPVIFVTSLLNPGDETLGFEVGGVDYLTKPVIGAIVRSRVRTHLALKESQNELESQNEELRRAQKELEDAREYAENIVETVRKPLVVLSSDLKILSANHSFYENFKVTPEDTIGNSIYDLGNRQWDIPKLRVLFKDILPHDTVFNEYEVEHDFPHIGLKTFLLNARQIYRKNIGSHIILLAMEDISDSKQLQDERSRMAMIVESSKDAIFCVSQDDLITSWNEGAENIFGYSAVEIIGKQIFTIIPAELYRERSHIWQTILSGEQLQYFEATRIRKDGKQIYVSFSTSPLLNTEGEIVGNSVIARDVTERRNLEETIQHQAHYDALTNLPNRLYFMDLLALGLAQARRNGKKLALLFLDLNGFKQVNDTLGHNCGDRLLQEVAKRLKASIRETDTVARLGGDEFTVLMPDLTRSDDVHIVVRKILGAFETPFILDGLSVDSATSIGVSMFPDDDECGEKLLKKADSAMYSAKESGRNSCKYYNAEISAHKIDEVQL